jgi:hypothetical protein
MPNELLTLPNRCGQHNEYMPVWDASCSARTVNTHTHLHCSNSGHRLTKSAARTPRNRPIRRQPSPATRRTAAALRTPGSSGEHWMWANCQVALYLHNSHRSSKPSTRLMSGVASPLLGYMSPMRNIYLHNITDSKLFRKQLKTYYFSCAFCDNVMHAWATQ